jgi:hypothetical protein
MRTLNDPITTGAGGPTHRKLSPTVDAGNFPIRTVGTPGPMLFIPTWGIGGVPGVTMGHRCISDPIRIAGTLLISTVGHPGPMTDPPCAVMEPSFVAGPGMADSFHILNWFNQKISGIISVLCDRNHKRVIFNNYIRV